MVGELPTLQQALEVEAEWKKRNQVPKYVYEVLRAMPPDSHPMTMYSAAILSMQRESVFAREIHEIGKENFWQPMLEDSLNLTAKLPQIAAFIYNLKYKAGRVIASDPALDWGADFAHMMGIDDPQYMDLSRLYFCCIPIMRAEMSALITTHLVGSALSDIYLATSAGMNGLAGPLHGLANQECLSWLLDVYHKFGGVPSDSDLVQFAWDTLNSGQVIPGYGHAVLRKTDPRFIAQLNFGKKYFPGDDIFRLAAKVYEIVPDILKQQGKAKDPWPNVDAISGALQHHYGVREFDFYTVLFGVSRLLGVTSNAVWARALGQPIERPKSMTTAMLEDVAAKSQAG
jgi:citrate synthase